MAPWNTPTPLAFNMQEVVLFKAPILEFENGKQTIQLPYMAPVKLTVKIETLEALEEPLQFKFVFTDGEIDRAIKEAQLMAPTPKKQKFTVELPWEMAKNVADALRSQCVLIDVSYKGTPVSRMPILVGTWDGTGKYKFDEEDNSDEDMGSFEELEELEELEEFEEMEEEAEDEEEEKPQEQANAEQKTGEEAFDELKKVPMTKEIADTFSKSLAARSQEGRYKKNIEMMREE